MIAWTSPLPISRSIPWRISFSGLPSGATRSRREAGGSSSAEAGGGGAAGADDEAGIAEAHHELFEVRPRQVLVGGDVGQAGRASPEPPPELDHQADTVFALGAEGDGTRTMEGRPGRVAGLLLCQGRV